MSRRKALRASTDQRNHVEQHAVCDAPATVALYGAVVEKLPLIPAGDFDRRQLSQGWQGRNEEHTRQQTGAQRRNDGTFHGSPERPPFRLGW
jgi:hypothetical protein